MQRRKIRTTKHENLYSRDGLVSNGHWMAWGDRIRVSSRDLQKRIEAGEEFESTGRGLAHAENNWLGQGPDLRVDPRRALAQLETVDQSDATTISPTPWEYHTSDRYATPVTARIYKRADGGLVAVDARYVPLIDGLNCYQESPLKPIVATSDNRKTEAVVMPIRLADGELQRSAQEVFSCSP